jgi:tRNA A-37 threonylcarbamoyl transferase component Bud32
MDRLFVNPKFEQTWAAIGLHRFDDIVGRFLPDYGKRRKVTVRRVSIPDGNGSTEAFFKLYHHRPGGWRFWLRSSKVRCEFENYATFDRLGVPAAQAIACGEDRDALGRLHRNFIITRAVPDAVPLDQFIVSCPSWSERRDLTVELARILRRLHAANFFYHDLVWRNILVSRSAKDGRRLFLIDCPRGRTARLGRTTKRLRDLASLDKTAAQRCSRTERLRFLLQYLGKKRLDGEARALARQCIEYRRARWPEDWLGK